MRSLRSLVPLLATAGILIGGNGLQGTLVALRGSEEGFSATVVGLIGTGYYIGFMIGCAASPRLLRAIGHIRAFATMAALAAVAALAMVLVIEPVTWFVLRVVSGICIASLFANVEGWLNASVGNENRAKTLSIYRFVDLFSVTASQYAIPVLGVGGFAGFAVMSMALMLSLVPVSLADRSNPTPPADFAFSLREVWALSPLACVGCIAVGLSNASFRSIGPIYAEGLGLDIAAIANFMSAGIIGGVVLQYPLGYISDRIDRRIVLLAATCGAVVAGLYLTLFAGRSEAANIAGVFLFGAFSLPLYSLSCAHANDHAGETGYVQIASGLLFFWAAGAVVGPLVASMLIDWFGPRALFAFTTSVQAGFVAYTVRRMSVRAGVPASARKGRFTALLRTSPFFTRMAAKAARTTPPGEDKGGHFG